MAQRSGGVEARWGAQRARMIADQLKPRGITDAAVLRAMGEVPRHAFVPHALRSHAYEDRPLPIGFDQTISQPFIVARMTELAGPLGPGSRVLDVGTGSGYQAAVLAALGAEVWSIEIIEALARRASEALRREGFQVTVRAGDGYAGWPEHAPFDAILVAAAAPHVPEPLLEQLKIGGRLVLPVGELAQELRVITRVADGWAAEDVLPVRFVPMTGRVQG